APLFLVPRPQAPEMRAQRNVERDGQHRDAVLAALRLAHDELTALERDVLDPQSQRLHETQPAAVEQARDQPRSTLQPRQQCVGAFGRERRYTVATIAGRPAPCAGRGDGYASSPVRLRTNPADSPRKRPPT